MMSSSDDRLAQIDSKLTADWVKTWIRNPRAVKPATWMPRIWYNSNSSSPEEAVWQQGYCPICGGWPLLAELRGIELAQYLRCAACGSGWRSRRMFCP